MIGIGCIAASSAAGGDDVDPQRRTASGDRKQAVDIGMSAGAAARIRCVLGEQGQAVFGRFRIQGVKDLLQILVDGERALLARLVFDAGDHSALAIDEVDALHAIDGR